MNRTKAKKRMKFVWMGVLIIILSSCANNPTPYQPLSDDGGYEESRLQKDMWRVSFKGNRYTSETDVMDFLYLRSAELTLESGYSHFLIEENFGKTQTKMRSTGPRFGMGFGTGTSSSFWGMGMGFGSEPEYEGYVSYHLAVFVIRMQNTKEPPPGKEVFDAAFLVESLKAKKMASMKKDS